MQTVEQQIESLSKLKTELIKIQARLFQPQESQAPSKDLTKKTLDLNEQVELIIDRIELIKDQNLGLDPKSPKNK